MEPAHQYLLSQRLVSSNVDFDLEEKEMMTTGKTTTHAPKTIVTTQFPNTNQGGTSGSWLPNNKVSINLDFETNNIEHTDSVTTSVPKTTMSLSTAKSSKPEIDTTVGSTPTTAPATMSTMTTGDQPAISVTNPQEDNQKTTTGSNIDSSKPGVEPSSDGTITTTVSSPTSTMPTTEHITTEPTALEKAESSATSTGTMDNHEPSSAGTITTTVSSPTSTMPTTEHITPEPTAPEGAESSATSTGTMDNHEPSSAGTITTTVSSPTSTMPTTEHITPEPTVPEKAESSATSTGTMDNHEPSSDGTITTTEHITPEPTAPEKAESFATSTGTMDNHEPSSDGTTTTTVSSPTSTMSTTEHITREPTAPEKADSPATSTATMDKHAETTSPVSINVDHSDAGHTDSASMPPSIETNNKADGVTQSSSSVIAEIGTHCNATAEEPADKNEPIPIEIDRNENDLAPKDDVTTIANEAAVENEPNNQKETSTQPNVLDQIAESCGETKKKCETTTSIPVEIQESNENVAITTIKPTNEATQMFNVIKEAIEETSSVPLISSTIGSLPNTAREKGNQDDGSVSPTDETSTVDPENDSKMFRGSISVIVPLLFIILISNSLN
ncbi:mucin-2-like [Sitodiplosis mosellana]|uniref:mucin-2-like n=1 Tax=Sitodiplosis mosellana TaxID=263140 RepID=UPI00244511A6|nr:mucin-2-like [Sitodiplosis mosellana]